LQGVAGCARHVADGRATRITKLSRCFAVFCCVAVCCRVLQCIAGWFREVQGVAGYCRVL